MKLIYTIVLLLAGFTLKAQIGTWRTFNKTHYSVQYPSGWTVDSSRQFGADVFIAAPVDTIGDKFKENVNVMVQNIAGQNVDMDRYVSVSEEQIKTMMTDCEIIESNTITTAPTTYHKIIFTGRQGAFALKIEQYYFITKDKAFVVTFTAEQKRFDDYQVTGEKILQSFRLK